MSLAVEEGRAAQSVTHRWQQLPHPASFLRRPDDGTVPPANVADWRMQPPPLPLRRGAWRQRQLGHAFLGTPQAFVEEAPAGVPDPTEQKPIVAGEGKGEEEEAAQQKPAVDMPLCFNREGNVCNKNQQSEEDDTAKALDWRMNALKKAEKEPWFWPEVHKSTEKALAEKANVSNKVKDYLRAREAFERTFESYHDEAQQWASSLRGLEDDYALYCRPFHDPTMKCEYGWRKVLRLWFAREPLPECAVGVVTPYTKLPTNTVTGWFSGIFGF